MKNSMYFNNSAQAYGFAGLRHYISDIDAVLARCRTASDQAEAFDETLIAEIWDESPEPRLQVLPERSAAPFYSDNHAAHSRRAKSAKKSSVLPAALSVAAIVAASVGAVGVMQYLEHRDSSVPEVGSLQLTESAPPIGRGLVLNPSQLRYCIAQSIRLGAVSDKSAQLSSFDTEKLQRMYNDYDDRCAEYRFQSGAFDTARRQVESHRTELEKSGLALFNTQQNAVFQSQDQQSSDIQQTAQLRLIDGEAPRVTDAAAREVIGMANSGSEFDREPRKYIRDMQWRLYKLKYYHGPIDGVDSQATQDALRGFFSVHDIAADTKNEKAIFRLVDEVYQNRQ